MKRKLFKTKNRQIISLEKISATGKNQYPDSARWHTDFLFNLSRSKKSYKITDEYFELPLPRVWICLDIFIMRYVAL